MFPTGFERATTIFLCHNCSDLNSPSGEACRIEAFYGVDHDEILHGANDCVMGYQRMVSDEERKEFECLILPDEVSIDTDFYKLESKEAVYNLRNIISKPLWDLNLLIFYKSNEDQLWDKAKDLIFKEKQKRRAEKWKAIKLNDAIEEAGEFMNRCSVCVGDPLSSKMVR